MCVRSVLCVRCVYLIRIRKQSVTMHWSFFLFISHCLTALKRNCLCASILMAENYMWSSIVNWFNHFQFAKKLKTIRYCTGGLLFVAHTFVVVYHLSFGLVATSRCTVVNWYYFAAIAIYYFFFGYLLLFLFLILHTSTSWIVHNKHLHSHNCA